MKEGWEYKTIGEVIDHLRTGLNPRTHFKLNTPDAEGYYITVRELKGFAIEPDEKTDKVNRTAIKRINERSNLKIGDVLFSGTGTIGKTALVSELPVNWNIKEGVYAMTPKHSELNSKYFIYYIGSDLFLRLVNDKAAGTGVRSIPMKELVKLPISIPSLSEQQSIVDYLDSAFEKIDAMKANAEKALNEAKALFQASLKEMLEPKEGWEEKPLKDISIIQSGFPFKSSQFEKAGQYQVIRMGNVRNGLIRYNESPVFVNNIDDSIKEKALLQLGDMIITQTGSRNKRDYGFTVLIEKEGLLLNQRIARIRVKDTISNKYLLYYSWTDYFRDQYFANEGGTVGQGNVGIDAIKDAIIAYPSTKEQQTIVSILDSLKYKADKLQENYDKISLECDALKQAVLRKVFE